jgi:hypothetical protein
MSSTDTKVVDLSSLSEDEKKIYASQRISKFYLTILICAIYGSISLVMLLLTIFTSWGKRYLYDEMLAFVVTFIIGTIIIIIFLANEIYTFKPVQAGNSLKYDAELCPDYWKLVYTQDDDINRADDDGKYFFKNVNKYQLKQRCEIDDKIIKPEDFIVKDSAKYKKGTGTDLYVEIPSVLADAKTLTGLKDEDLQKFREYSAVMAGYDFKENALTSNNSYAYKQSDGSFFTNNVPVACDVVYPVYLSIQDGDKNKFRCAYAKTCGITWTDAGCE